MTPQEPTEQDRLREEESQAVAQAANAAPEGEANQAAAPEGPGAADEQAEMLKVLEIDLRLDQHELEIRALKQVAEGTKAASDGRVAATLALILDYMERSSTGPLGAADVAHARRVLAGLPEPSEEGEEGDRE